MFEYVKCGLTTKFRLIELTSLIATVSVLSALVRHLLHSILFLLSKLATFSLIRSHAMASTYTAQTGGAK